MAKNIIEKIKSCNVVYHSLGETDRSAMPLGNGELCTSTWVDKDGKICFYLSRSDALTEYDRTVKLGMVKVDFHPNPFVNSVFEQELDVADGCIRFMGENAEVKMVFDTETNTVALHGIFAEDTDVTAEYINWRKKDTVPPSSFDYQVKIVEKADIVQTKDNGVLFYHKNGDNIIQETAINQEVDDCMEVLPDFLTDRIFGGFMCLEDGAVNDNTSVKKSAKEFTFRIFTESIQGSEAEFEQKLKDAFAHKKSFDAMEESTRAFWNEYWNNSYIFVENDAPASKHVKEKIYEEKLEEVEYTTNNESSVTTAYVWTRFMFRCCGTGAFPILYNGMLFNLCPGNNEHYNINTFGKVCSTQPGEITSENNPDERTWCVEHLWQNIRHPYYGFLRQGTPELMKTMFAYYRRFWDLNRKRAEKYYHAEGQHNTEMTMSFGLQSIGIYGADRTGKPAGWADNRHGGSVDISPGLELLTLMLDYYDYTGDETFFKEEVQIYAKDLCRYIETRFKNRADGKIVMEPLNSIETYWDTKNPVSVVAGVHYIVDRILKTQKLDKEIEVYFTEYQKILPAISLTEENGKVFLDAAEEYDGERHNVEITELYACFPFRAFELLSDGKDIMTRTFVKRLEQYGCDRCFTVGDRPDTPSYSGWQYQGIVAARLGMAEKAKTILENNVQLRNPGCRFPAMWGPIYDAVPDTDHGGNIVHLLQEMLMQIKDGKAYILPAFPKEWDATFKLHVDCNTIVEAVYEKGVLKELQVFPESEKGRIIVR